MAFFDWASVRRVCLAALEAMVPCISVSICSMDESMIGAILLIGTLSLNLVSSTSRSFSMERSFRSLWDASDAAGRGDPRVNPSSSGEKSTTWTFSSPYRSSMEAGNLSLVPTTKILLIGSGSSI
jgi:hypothetical protein